MAKKDRRNLCLYLAVACFVGIVAIFIVDGYLGVYDTFYITANEQEREIAPDYWLHSKREGYPYNIGAEWGEPIHFRYEVDNRCLSSYSTAIEASIWKENKKIFDLCIEDKLIKPFDKVMVEWTLDSEQLQSRGFSVGEYTVKVERKGVERKIIVGYHTASSGPLYPITPPPPKLSQ